MSIEKFINQSKRQTVKDTTGEILTRVSAITSNRALSDDKMTGMMLSMESLDSTETQVLSTAYNNIESSLNAIVSDYGYSLEGFQLEAAAIAGVMSSNPRMALAAKPKMPTTSNQHRFIRPNTGDGSDSRAFAMSLEAYDERDNRNAQLYSIVYNLLASRQDDFGEAFFPTIVVNPTEVGILLEVKLFMVMNDFKRSVTGALAEFQRKNVIRGYTDATILKNELTKAVPVCRTTGGSDDSTASFVASTDVTPYTVNVDGTTVTTSALKIGKEVDLIGLSQTAELLASGIMDVTDSLDSYARLEKVFVKFVDGIDVSVVAFDVSNLPDSIFTYAPQGNYRKMILNIDTSSVIIGAATTDVAGAALAALPELTAGMVGRLKLNIGGSINLETGSLVVNNGSVGLTVLRNASGVALTPAAGLVTKISEAKVIGYTVTAYRSNTNLRQRGQLTSTTVESQIVNINYRSPVSSIMPVTDASGNDSSVLQTLVTITSIRISNEAVSSLLKAEQAMVSYKAVANADGVLPDMIGIGRYYVKPTYFSEAINLANTVDSRTSHERLKDIRASLIEKIRYYATEMYRSSEYKAAALVLNGNINFKPTVVVGTDPVLFNYLMADGDIRSLGDQFDVKIVATLDSRMAGKIILAFGVFDTSRNSVVNPLNFGNLLWSPETTVVLPISRNGQISKEMMVAPRFLHMTVCPIMTSLTVTGLPTVLNKVNVNTVVA